MLLFICSNIVIISLVQQKQKRELKKMQADYDGATESASRRHEKKISAMKERVAEARKLSEEEKAKWQSKLDKRDLELSTAKDRVYAEKAKCRSLVAKQIAETQRVQMQLQNYPFFEVGYLCKEGSRT